MPAQRQATIRSLKSCEVCRRRKTRCELPDAALDLPPSDTPLSAQLVCYRCRVLGLPCILVASSRAAHQPRNSAILPNAGSLTSNTLIMGLPGSSTGGAERQSAAASASGMNTPDLLASTHTADNHALHTGDKGRVDIVLTAFEPQVTPPDAIESLTTSTPAHNSLIYHGQPLELTNVMIKMSYGQNGHTSALPLSVSELEGEAMDEHVKGKIALGYQELCTFVVHLPSFTDILHLPSSMPGMATQTLHHLTLYLASLPFRTDPQVDLFANQIGQKLPSLIMRLILEHPQSLHAVQVFSLLSTFAPFGGLPGQITLPDSIIVARGYIATANAIAAKCHLSGYDPLQPSTAYSQTSPDTWLWLSLVASDSLICLEQLVPSQPSELDKAAELAAQLTVSLRTSRTARLAGLALCERLHRLKEVYDALNQIHRALETSDDILGSITRSLARTTRSLDALDDKYDSLLESLDETPTYGWMVTRSVRRLYETGVVQRTAIRSLYAAAYLPVPTANPPSIFSASDDAQTSALASRMRVALAQATNPLNVARFFMQDPSPPSVEIAQEWISKRSDGLEEILVALAELDLTSSGVPLAPWHGIVAIVLDTSNVIFETQAAHIVLTRAVKRLKRDLRTSQRLYLMRCAAQKIATLEPTGPFQLDHQPSETSTTSGKTVSTMCSELIKAMVRAAEGRIKSLQKEASSSAPSNDRQGLTQGGYLTKGSSSESNSAAAASTPPIVDLSAWPTSLPTFDLGSVPGTETEVDLWAILAQSLRNPNQHELSWPASSSTGALPSTQEVDDQVSLESTIDPSFDWLFD